MLLKPTERQCKAIRYGDGKSVTPGPHETFDVAILGARLHYAVPRILDRAGLLNRFYTDFYIGTKPRMKRALEAIPSRLSPAALKRMLGREGAGLNPARVVSFDALTFRQDFHKRRVRSRRELYESFAATAKAFCLAVNRTACGSPSAVYALNGAALEIFERAKERGIKCMLEQIIAPSRLESQLLLEEAERWPGWSTLPECADDSSAIAEREEREWQLADRIVCGSEFVADNVHRMSGAGACRVVPYGVELDRFDVPRGRIRSGSLRLLFVGAVGLRKGAQYLLKALRLLGSDSIECRFAGGLEVNPDKLEPLPSGVELLGHVPRSEVRRAFEWADVLVLPSICEGSALATYEALAAGLPVITTPNAGSVVRDGHEGFVVPIRDAEAIADRITRLAENPALLESMSRQARLRAREFDLEAYGRNLIQVIREVNEPEQLLQTHLAGAASP